MRKLFLYVLICVFVNTIAIAQCPNQSRPGIHVVQSGENLYRISKMYNLTISQLASTNRMSVNTTLYPCQELAVGTSTSNARPDYYSYQTSVRSVQPQVYQQPANYSENNYSSYDNFAARSGQYASYTSPQRQASNKHEVRPGETVADIAEIYGYTEARFRAINLLKPNEEPTVGSVLLSTDCACNRVMTYDELNTNINKGSVYNDQQFVTTGVNTGRNPDANTRKNNSYPADNFYTQPRGVYSPGSTGSSSSTPPPVVPIGGQIRSLSQPSSYKYTSGTTIYRGGGAIPAAKATYMSQEELDMLDEINLLRANPQGYIPYVEQYKRDLQSGKSFGSSLEVCDELIRELRQTPPLSILMPSPCLFEAASNHGRDMKARGSTGHDGSDGSWPWDRVRRACPDMTDGSENLVGGPNDIREAVLLLLVDDGIPDRGHRKTLLNPDWTHAVCYKAGQVGYMPNVWVQKFGF